MRCVNAVTQIQQRLEIRLPQRKAPDGAGAFEFESERLGTGLAPFTAAPLRCESKSRISPAVFQPAVQRWLCQIRMRPTAASAAPYPAHWIWLIMKLVFGQAMVPVPWPIQSRPIASASRPTIKSNLRITFPAASRIPASFRPHEAVRNLTRQPP